MCQYLNWNYSAVVLSHAGTLELISVKVASGSPRSEAKCLLLPCGYLHLLIYQGLPEDFFPQRTYFSGVRVGIIFYKFQQHLVKKDRNSKYSNRTHKCLLIFISVTMDHK